MPRLIPFQKPLILLTSTLVFLLALATIARLPVKVSKPSPHSNITHVAQTSQVPMVLGKYCPRLVA